MWTFRDPGGNSIPSMATGIILRESFMYIMNRIHIYIYTYNHVYMYIHVDTSKYTSAPCLSAVGTYCIISVYLYIKQFVLTTCHFTIFLLSLEGWQLTPSCCPLDPPPPTFTCISLAVASGTDSLCSLCWAVPRMHRDPGIDTCHPSLNTRLWRRKRSFICLIAHKLLKPIGTYNISLENITSGYSLPPEALAACFLANEPRS